MSKTSSNGSGISWSENDNDSSLENNDDNYEEDSFLVNDDNYESSYENSPDDDSSINCNEEEVSIYKGTNQEPQQENEYQEPKNTKAHSFGLEPRTLRRSNRLIQQRDKIKRKEEITSSQSSMIDDPSEENSIDHPFGSSRTNENDTSSINTENEEESISSFQKGQQLKGQLTIDFTLPFHEKKDTTKK